MIQRARVAELHYARLPACGIHATVNSTVPVRRLGLAAIALVLALSAAFVICTNAGAQTAEPAGVPVRLDGKELFRLHTGIDQKSADERARLVEDRLYDLALNPFRPSGDFALRELEGRSEIHFGDRFVIAVTDADAAAEARPRSELAAARLELLRNEVAARRADYWRPKRLAVSFLATAAFSAAMWFVVGFVRRRLAAYAGKLAAERPEDMQTGPAAPDLMHRFPIRPFLAKLVRGSRTLFLLASIGIWLFVVMSFFPRSRFVAVDLLDRLLDVLATVWKALAGYIPNLMFLVVIGVITYLVIRLARFIFGEVARGTLSLPGFDPEWSEPTSKIAVFLILALSAVMAFPYLPGSQSHAFQAVSLFLGLLISLSSSSAISNIIAGVILTYTGAFRLGDRVRIAEAFGDVVDKTLLVTRIRTAKNVDIAIPNALVLSSHIVNYSHAARDAGLILHTTVTIGYDAAWRQVHELLVAAALSTNGILDDPAPFVLQTSLDDFFVSYEINAFTRNPRRMMLIYAELHQNIQDRFNEAGVEIMSPHFAALRDGNAEARPASSLPDGYEAPGFRIVEK